MTINFSRYPLSLGLIAIFLSVPVAYAQEVGTQTVTQQTTTTTQSETQSPMPLQLSPESQQVITTTTQSPTQSPMPLQLSPQSQQVITTTTQPIVPPQQQVTTTISQPTTAVTQQQVVTTAVTPVHTTNQDMTVEQFQQWLAINRYAQRQPVNTVSRVRSRSANKVIPNRKPLTYEESQQVMLETLPVSAVPPVPEANVAFNALLQQNMPLTPQQVLKLRQQIDVAQRAASTPPIVPPKPVSSTIMVSLAPGSTPPVIRLAQGYVTSLVFVDSTSQPWPIAAFDIGNPKAVNMQWDGKSNILLIQAISPYSNGDIVIRLVGNNTPITLELVSGQRVVDYRVDLHVPGIGPNTKDLPMGTGLPNNANQLLLSVLDGIAPSGSRPVTIHGIDGQGWVLGEKMYLRMRLTLLSPGWMGTMESPDGMHAYELPKTSSILVSRYGEPVELKVEGL